LGGFGINQFQDGSGGIWRSPSSGEVTAEFQGKRSDGSFFAALAAC
jgi:hypothetical protein